MVISEPMYVVVFYISSKILELSEMVVPETSRRRISLARCHARTHTR